MNTNNNHSMRVSIYSRISKDSSELDNQLIILREYCKQMGYEITDEYSDIASGGSQNRQEFNRMMRDASKRKFDMVIFYALDRFTREGTRKTIHYLQILEDYGIAYKSYTEQYIDSSGIFKDVIIALLSTLAKQERIRISERVKAGLERSKKKNGRSSINATKVSQIRDMKANGMSIVAISKKLQISRGSVYQYLGA